MLFRKSSVDMTIRLCVNKEIIYIKQCAKKQAPIYMLSCSKAQKPSKFRVTDTRKNQWTFYMTPHGSQI